MDFLEQYNKIIEMKDYELYKFFSSCSDIEKEKLVVNPYIVKMPSKTFKSMFNNLDYKYLLMMLDNEKVYEKLMSLDFNNKLEMRFFKFLNYEVFKKIIENPNIDRYYDVIRKFFASLTKDEFNNYLKLKIDNNCVFTSLVKNEISEKYNINKNENMLDLFCNKINQGMINPFVVFRLSSYKDFVVYTKFGLIVNDPSESEYLVLNNGFFIPFEIIKTSPESHINRIINLLNEKYKINDQGMILEMALELYYSFGYDITKKIIEDKFTNMTDSAIQRICEFSFKKERQKYRTKHPEEFYQHNMIEKVLLEQKSVYNILFADMDSNQIKIILEEFNQIRNSTCFVEEQMEAKIKEIINERENRLKEEYYCNLKKKLSLIEPMELSLNQLYDMLKDINVNYVRTYSADKLESLAKLLFGNTKKDNDCLFRLIVQNQSNGIMLGDVVNNIDFLTSVSKNKKISLSNILEITNILRMKRFFLEPDERDISLETLTRIINSKHYCSLNEQDLICELLKLHHERKNKVYSTIPFAQGEYQNIKYEVAPFDADYLLAAGIDGKNCFKIGGPGEDLFKYCLTNPNGVIVYLTDDKGEKFICPVIRSGNGIHCNGIDPETDSLKQTELLSALECCFKEMIKKSHASNINDRIEVATITNLHITGKLNREIYNLEVGLPLNHECYNDYNKADSINYILTNSKGYKKNYYYESNDKYYYPRASIYESYKNEVNKIDDEILCTINAIAYSAIDYKNVKNKNKLKREFKEYTNCDFEYIVGNKDWFIAVDNNYNIIANLLPYDKRAKQEYFEYYNKLLKNMSKGEENGKNRKNI